MFVKRIYITFERQYSEGIAFTLCLPQKNLDILLREETKLPITITEDPLSTVVLGSGKALDNISILKE